MKQLTAWTINGSGIGLVQTARDGQVSSRRKHVVELSHGGGRRLDAEDQVWERIVWQGEGRHELRNRLVIGSPAPSKHKSSR